MKYENESNKEHVLFSVGFMSSYIFHCVNHLRLSFFIAFDKIFFTVRYTRINCAEYDIKIYDRKSLGYWDRVTCLKVKQRARMSSQRAKILVLKKFQQRLFTATRNV